MGALSYIKNFFTKRSFGGLGSLGGLLGHSVFNLNQINPTDLPQLVSAYSIDTVYACDKLIKETISSLSRNVYFIDDHGNKKKDLKHPINSLIKRKPHQYLTWIQILENWISSYSIKGNGIILIKSRDKIGNATEIEFRDNHMISIVFVDKLPYYVDHKDNVTYNSCDVMHIGNFLDESMIGVSAIGLHRRTLGKITAAQDMENRLYTAGFFLGGIIEYPETITSLSDGTIEKLNKRFKELYGRGIAGTGDVGIISHGGKFKPLNISMPLTDADYIRSMNKNTESVCRIFLCPPTKIFHLEKPSYNSYEHLDLDFMRSCILPKVKKIEEQLLKLFNPNDSMRFIRLEINSLERADNMTTIRTLKESISTGLLSVNEARQKIDANPVPGGDKHYIPSNNLSDINQKVKDE